MQLTQKHCIPCENGDPAITDENEELFHKQVPDWLLLRDGTHRIRRQFNLKTFTNAIAFVNKIAEVAEKEEHHPDIYIFYNKVQIDLFTHAVGGLSENDFILAAKIDEIVSKL